MLFNREARKRALGDLICNRSSPITCDEFLPPLLSFALDTLNEIEQLDRCFDLSHTETLDSSGVDVLIKDIRLAFSLAIRCLHQIRTTDGHAHVTT